KRGKEQGFWQPHQTIVVAVSGGVDSMALLTLMEQVAEKEQLQLVVAHVNHQLREASVQEAQYLATYCQQRELTYYETRWEDPEKQRNLEAKARTFR
ncbi:tRNA(Ile)-lysidine synthetase, partial [Proteus mirabilis]|nr:tRNA(Ile)-lysidine synthetase [Proteus mirabilis]